MLELVPLEVVATIKTPLVFRDKAPVDTPEGNVRIFSIKDLVSWRPDEFDRLSRVEIEERKLSDSVQPGDILMPGRGLSYPARLFEGSDLPLLPAGQVHVIRINSELITSGYLNWFLNRYETQEKIRQMLTGSTIMALNKSQLARLMIELPSRATQEKIANLDALGIKRRVLREHLIALEQEEIATACRLALQREAENG